MNGSARVLVPGAQHDAQTFLDTAVFDGQSASIDALFAPAMPTLTAAALRKRGEK